MLALLLSAVCLADEPQWLRFVDVGRGKDLFPDDDVVQLYRFRMLEVDKSGKKRVTIRELFHVRKGTAEDYSSYRFVETHWSRVKKLVGWRIDPQGEIHKSDRLIRTQLYGGELYTESREVTLSIPATGPGSIFGFELEYESGLRVANTDWWPERRGAPVVRWEYRLSLPEGWDRASHWVTPARDLVEAAPADEVDSHGVALWERWEIPAPPEKEPYQPPRRDLRRALATQYFDTASGTLPKSWSDVSRWYQGFSHSALQDREELQQVSAEILGGVEGREEKIKTIADFVRSSVNYVQIYLDDGGWRPHPAGEVYENRYGDCKDMAHLAMGLLEVSGIEAHAVLTNGDAVQAFPQIPAPQFDHCIVGVPGADDESFAFFDPTAKTVPYGRLPARLEGAWALVTGSAADTSLIRLPSSTPSDNRTLLSARLTVSDDLSVVGEVEEIRVGQPAFSLRSRFLDQSPDEILKGRQERLANALNDVRVTDLRLDGLDEVTDTLRFSYSFKAPSAGRRLGSRLLLQPDVLTSRDRVLFDSEERIQEIWIAYPYSSQTEIDVALPGGWGDIEIPQPVAIRNDFGSYTRKVEIVPGGIRVTRREETSGTRFPVEQYPQAREWDQTVYQSDRELIVVSVR